MLTEDKVKEINAAVDVLTGNHPLVRAARNYGKTAYIEAINTAVESMKERLHSVTYRPASETDSIFMYEEEEALNDRKLFVHNLGVLLSQTREGIAGAELDDNEIVTIKFIGGDEIHVNVNMDSYLAIIIDVTKKI